jgi:hypothetical protein
MERAHIEDVDATAEIADKADRYAALAKLAKSGGYAGMFDPVTGNFIDTDGNAAFIGAYKAEVQQLANHGLIPNAAKEKTSHLLGNMGMDEKEAGGIQSDVRTREKAIRKATGFIDKALETFKTAQPTTGSNVQSGTPDKPAVNKPVDPFAAPTMTAEGSSFRTGLAQALTESFGYNYQQLIEGITRDEHKYIKQVLAQVDKVQNDDDVVEFKTKYAEYTKRRDALIQQIKALIEEIQSKPLQESQQLDEGVIDVLKSIAGKAALPLYAMYEVYHAWQAIKSIPSGWPKERYKNEVTKIIAKPIAEIGISAFAIAIGTMLAGPIGGFGAGVASLFVTNSTADAIATGIADLIYSGGKSDATDNKETQTNTDTTNPGSTALHQHLQFNKSVQDLQNKLGKDKLPKFGADGKLGKETIGAIQAYRKEKGIKSDAEVIAQLLGIKDTAQAMAAVQPTSESIIYSSMTEAERMAYLAKRLRGIEQVNEGLKQRFATGVLDALGIGVAERAILSNIGTKDVAFAAGKFKGTKWDWNDGLKKYVEQGGRGRTLGPKEMASEYEAAEKSIANTSAAKAELKAQAGQETTYTDMNGRATVYRKNNKGEWQQLDQNGAPITGSEKRINQKGVENHYATNKGSASTTAGTPAPASTPTPAPGATGAVTGKTTQAIEKLKNSRLGKLASNPVFLTIAGAIGMAGFLFTQDGNIIQQGLDSTSDQVSPNNTNNTNNPNNTVTPNTDNKEKETEKKEDPRLAELKSLVQQYNDAYPDDPLPGDLQAQVNKLTGTTTANVGTDNKPSTDKSSMPTYMQGPYVDTRALANGINSGKINPDAGGDVNNTTVRKI